MNELQTDTSRLALDHAVPRDHNTVEYIDASRQALSDLFANQSAHPSHALGALRGGWITHDAPFSNPVVGIARTNPDRLERSFLMAHGEGEALPVEAEFARYRNAWEALRDSLCSEGHRVELSHGRFPKWLPRRDIDFAEWARQAEVDLRSATLTFSLPSELILPVAEQAVQSATNSIFDAYFFVDRCIVRGVDGMAPRAELAVLNEKLIGRFLKEKLSLHETAREYVRLKHPRFSATAEAQLGSDLSKPGTILVQPEWLIREMRGSFCDGMRFGHLLMARAKGPDSSKFLDAVMRNHIPILPQWLDKELSDTELIASIEVFDAYRTLERARHSVQARESRQGQIRSNRAISVRSGERVLCEEFTVGLHHGILDVSPLLR